MTIRSRLLLLLLPAATGLLILISCFFYLNWSYEILNGYKSRLLSIVVSTAQGLPAKEIEKLIKKIHDPDIVSDPNYQTYYKRLVSLKRKLPVTQLYIVQIEPVQEGEYLLPDSPDHPLNEVYHSNDSTHPYRQVVLMQTGENARSSLMQAGEYDFSETDERQVYLTKEAFVTPVYEARKTHERLVSAYAPILNAQREVIALLGADVDIKEIDQKLQRAWFIIVIGACITLAFVTLTIFLIADRISKPVQQLNQAALAIAAGDYESNIQVKGPREIVELAHTLNTMSECLVEHISRLRESSLIRERMYGEYECALLLQEYMLQKVIEEFKHPWMRLKLISVPASSLRKGLLLKMGSSKTALQLTLVEAAELGFTGLFELNQCGYLSQEQLQEQTFVSCEFSDNFQRLHYRHHHLCPPLVWSIKSQQFMKGNQQTISLSNQDMIFLYNSDLLEQFETPIHLENWLGRVLLHFAEDGLDTIHTMLTNELNFIAKKQQPIKRHFHILSLQIKTPETLI